MEIDDLVIDYDSKETISAVELLHASDFFKSIGTKGLSLNKKKLKELSNCKLEIITKQNFLILKFIFILKSKEEILAPIMIPSISEPSPAALA